MYGLEKALQGCAPSGSPWVGGPISGSAAWAWWSVNAGLPPARLPPPERGQALEGS